MKLSRYWLPILTALTLTVGCEDEQMRLSCEKVTLNNGLTVLLCQEGYAPVVTVGVTGWGVTPPPPASPFRRKSVTSYWALV